MIFLPTRGRPEWLANFVKHYRATGATHPVTLLMDDDEPKDYSAVLADLPAGWSRIVSKRASNSERHNAAFNIFPSEGVYGMQSDDIEPLTQGWDETLCRAAVDKGIAWPDDCHEQKCTLPFVRGDVVRAIGFFSPPMLKHLYCDTFWGELAAELKISGFVPEVKMKHHTEINDETHSQRQDGGDGGAWHTFRSTAFNELVHRMKRCLPLPA